MLMGKLMMVAAMVLGFTMAPSAWAAAATQAELEVKIKAMEQALQEMKVQLGQVRQEQKTQQQAVEAAATRKLPSWAERMTFFGDLRFRYDHTNYDETTIAGVPTNKEDKDRFRVRLRFGVRSQIQEDVEVGMRMTLGSDTDPTSTNVTMGNYFGEYTSWGIDQAYVKWTPSLVPDRALTFSFGKVPQPLYTTKIIWDLDVVPEGAFLNYTFNKGGNWRPFVTVAYMTVNQPGDWSSNVYAPAGQLGFRGKAGNLDLSGEAGYTSWGKLGDPGDLPPNLYGTPTYTTADGDERTTNYEVVDLYARAVFKFSTKGSVGVWGHVLQNLDSEGPYQDSDTGYGAATWITYGKFMFDVLYKHVEANASPGFIADSDSSYVNRKGWQFDAHYQMWTYGWVVLTYYNTEPVDDSIPGATNKSQTFFINTYFKF
jgi:hypothetical protein